MKHFLPKYLCFFFLLTLWLSAGKVLAQISYPGSIKSPTETGTYLFPPVSASDIDSVTIGATMPYYVLPDLNFNPKLQATATTYDQTKIFTKANIESSFSWTIPSGCTPSHVPSTASYPDLVNLDNFMNITFTTSVLQTITVNETSASTYGGCSGTTNFKVQVISKPTGGFTQATMISCPSTGSVTLSLPVTLSSDVAGITEKQMEFTLSLSKSGTDLTSSITQPTKIAEGSGTGKLPVTITGLSIGRYDFTITKVRDRISNKCNMDGIINATYSTMYVYILNPLPTLQEYKQPN